MVKVHRTTSVVEAFLALPFVKSIDTYYPDITDWYVNTVIPGISTGNDVLLMATENNTLVGIVLAKLGEERKLRCIRVKDTHVGSGLGMRLIDQALGIIGEKPLVSVSEELLHLYSRAFVKRYGFVLTEVIKGKYRKNKLEYYFNQ